MSKTVDINELVADLNDLQILPPMECIEDYNNAHGRKLYGRAADALDAMAGEVEKWKQDAAWDKAAARDFLGRAEEAEAERDRLKAALVRLRDCDWVISLPDRMDAVREIARKALGGDA